MQFCAAKLHLPIPLDVPPEQVKNVSFNKDTLLIMLQVALQYFPASHARLVQRHSITRGMLSEDMVQ